MKLFDYSKEITMRHEDKYICSKRQLELLDNRLKNFLKYDEHQLGDGYNVRSLYFDTENDRLLEESLSGVSPRKKYRIRIYNCSNSRISLEEKTSINQLKSKQSCLLDKDYVDNLINRGYCFEESLETDYYTNGQKELLKRFHVLRLVEGLKPVIIVDYYRTSYVYEVGNVRITLDRRIGASTQLNDFYNPNMLIIPVMPEDKALLEVKYDGILPGFISKLLDMGNMQHVSFSKYGLCRNIVEYNGKREEYYVI